VIGLAALRDRYLGDRHGGGAAPGLARALEAIGWRAVQDPTAEELAGDLVSLVEACVVEHHDPARLVGDVARLLRDHGPLLDGGLPPAEAYEPAAVDLLERYVAGPGERALPGFDPGFDPGFA
jgi:hypothetical protein